MVRHSARAIMRGTLSCVLPALIAMSLMSSAVRALEVNPDDKKPKTPDKDKDKDKGKGPEHNVSLMEEPGVNDLFNRAAKARARAEKEPEAWPDCIKAYADILKKYPNTVYLDKWEGPDKSLTAYKNGLYKSTRERVAAEIASLPPAAMTVYRVINDPVARSLYLEGQEQFDQPKMEQLVRDYFLTTWSNDALAWLAESSFERGAWRDAAKWYGKAAENPGKMASPVGMLARQVISYARAGNKESAARALEALTGAAKDPAKGKLRLGSDEGDAALAKLKARVEKMGAGEVPVENTETNQWPTYFGNASHTQAAQPRPGKGLKKWSMRIDDLLYGKDTVPPESDKAVTEDGIPTADPSINQQLTIKNGYFYINDGQVYAAYPIGNPAAGVLAAGGNAKYMLPSENVKNPPKRKEPKPNRNDGNPFVAANPVVQHPYFATLAGDRAYGVLGAESYAQTSIQAVRFRRFNRGGDDDTQRGPSNYLVCFGRSDATKETSILWSLKPSDTAFTEQSKADQDWLKGAYFTGSPTYDAGVLYASAVVISQTAEAWVAAFDAENGRMLWRTQICSAKPMLYGGLVQPDRGIPVAVSNRTVYAVTNLGAVAALEAGGGNVKWIRVYDRTKTVPDQMFGTGEEMAQSHQFWAPNPPIVYKNRLIVTPQDSETIYAYDIETGARAWERPRVSDQTAGDSTNAGRNPPPQSSYRHVLGVVNNVLVLTGSDILFINALTGQQMSDALIVDSPIKGRGALTSDALLISTEKELLRMGYTVQGKNVKLAQPQAYKWEKAKDEAGSVYSAGGVLYTVSHTHVNAYIQWEELEAKLKAQLQEKPDDYQARIELAGVYTSIERFDQTLKELETAKAAAEKAKGVAKADEALQEIRNQKFETLLTLGHKARAAGNADAAGGFYGQAYELSLTPGAADVLPVRALRAKGELLETSGKTEEAARTYQQIISKHGNAILIEPSQTSKMARLFAQTKLAELKAKDPASYAPIDAEAEMVLKGAGDDPAKLQAMIAQFPNSEHAGSALIALARLELEKSPDRARIDATRYVSRMRNGSHLALALAIQAIACERLGLSAASHRALQRLATSDELKDAKFSLQGLDPKAPPGEMSSREWAEKKLDDPLYKRAPSEAVFALGPGKLKHEPAWTKTNTENTIAMSPEGIPPVEMRRAVFYIENQTELAALSGRDGSELWKPRPVAPNGSRGRAFWWERLLIVCGENTITAYDSSDNGKAIWSQNLKIDGNATGYWCQISGDRLIVSHTGNILLGFDASTGVQLWKTTMQGFTAVPPVAGEGFLVVTPSNSNKLMAYNLDTGNPIWTADILELANSGTVNSNTKVAPVVSGDRVYVAQRAMKLRVLDAKTGKPAFNDIDVKGNITGLRMAGDLAIVSLDGTRIATYRTDGKAPAESWQPRWLTPVTAITDFFVDGDDLIVATVNADAKNEIGAYTIKGQGKLRWKQDMAADAALAMRPGLQAAGQQQMVNGMVIRGNGRVMIRRGNGFMIINGDDEGAQNFTYGTDGSGGWIRENSTRDHLMVLQSNYDPTGTQSKVAGLIDRATGRLVWDASLKNDPTVADGSGGLAKVQMFEGGVVLFESGKRKAFVSFSGGDEEELKDIAAKAAKNPTDMESRIKLAAALYDKGDREKAMAELAAVLSDAKTPDAAFAQAYAQFAVIRQDFAQQKRGEIVFHRVEKAPDVNGGSAGWEAVPDVTFENWRDVFLASEDLNSRAQPKKDAWKSGDDLKAVFKGAYDNSNLYLQITVKDDVQHNDQGEGGRIDFGDSLLLSFDMGLAGGEGYRGEAFELALGLAKSGKATGWRRVEHGKYTRGAAPLDKPFSVTRKDGEHLTIYQIALPLEYLTLKAEAGTKFGFCFAVQDQDAGTSVEKSVCPSPGLVGSRKPKFFSRGVLQEKK